jgi:membrane-bound lytic murein transglycosylase B
MLDRTRRPACLVLLVALACAPQARPEAAPPPPPPPPAQWAAPGGELATQVARAKGWGWLVEKLVTDGQDRVRVAEAFADPGLPDFDVLFFRVDPRESHALYRGLLREGSVAAARECRAENSAAFEAAEQATGVSADVIAAILHVETHCGRNTGSSVVLYGLARLAMANEPANVEANVARTATQDGVVDEELAARVRARAAQLEEIFYPEVIGTFVVAERLGIGPLELTGSPSGAFGTPQFLPTSYLRFGIDANGDGRVDLYDLPDAAASAGRFLAEYGWKPDLGRAEQRGVIWNYNRSDAYIDTVLAIAARIASSPDVAAGPLEAGQ